VPACRRAALPALAPHPRAERLRDRAPPRRSGLKPSRAHVRTRKALPRERHERDGTRWSDAGGHKPERPRAHAHTEIPVRAVDHNARRVRCPGSRDSDATLTPGCAELGRKRSSQPCGSSRRGSCIHAACDLPRRQPASAILALSWRGLSGDPLSGVGRPPERLSPPAARVEDSTLLPTPLLHRRGSSNLLRAPFG
jgi:hypothetical protein